MEVIYINDYRHINCNIDKLSLVLGYFDGLHIGHEQLINYAKFSTKGPVGVLTFDRPLKSIEGCLTSLDQKIELLRGLKVDYVFVMVASDDFRHLSYIDFIDKVLKKLNPITLFCGNDFSFGYEAKGNVNDLKMAFSDVKIVNYVNDFNHKKISSSNIKKLIINGDVKEASVFLGRPYTLSGTIGHGFQEGTKLGTPTANITLPVDYVIPKDGVYITKTKIDKRTYKSVTNIGTHPTINQIQKPIIETFIIGLNRNIYGKEMTISFYNRLRDEIKFDNIEKLEEQIKKDIDSTNQYFTKL
jgi:riboflavin kinase/FMN adenylyltransferase